MKHVVYLDNADISRLKSGESITIQGVEVRMSLSEYKTRKIEEADGAQSRELTDSDKRVLDALGAGAMTRRDLAKKAGITLGNISKYTRRLIRDGLIVSKIKNGNSRFGAEYSLVNGTTPK